MKEQTDPFLSLKHDYQESLEHLNDALLRLEVNPADRLALDTAGRQLHNVKGLADRVRAPKLGQVAHVLEDLLAVVREGRFRFDETSADLLFRGMDLFVNYLRTREVCSKKVARLVEDIELSLFGNAGSASEGTGLEALLPDFLAAARDNVEAISQGLVRLEKEPSERGALKEIYRNAHSLKGSASTMGFERMASLAHRIEDVLRAFQGGLLPVTTGTCDALLEANDAISVMLDTAAAGKRVKVDVEGKMQRLADCLRGIEPEVGYHDLESEKIIADSLADAPTTMPVIDTVRVATMKLDELVNLTGEAAIAQARLADEVDSLVRISKGWQSLGLRANGSYIPVVSGADNQGRLINQLVQLGNELEETCRSLEEAAENTGRHIKTLQHRTTDIRMLPLALVFNTLPRAVRDLCRQFGKQVNFEVEGEQTTIDKRILEKIGDPLMHMLRNALDHGIERPEKRLQAGKPEKGTIRLQAFQEGARVIITLKDDGRGIDPRRLKEVAIDKGFLDEGEAALLSEDHLLDLIFLPGFSTRVTVTDVSGRGVGMDVVHANVASLKGEVSVASEFGQGTSFSISLPLTLATVHALLVQCSGEILAIPTSSVAKVLQLPVEEIKSVQGGQAVAYQDDILRVRSLSEALAWQEKNEDLLVQPRVTLVILQSGERKIGFLVEEILGEREIVVKDLGSHLIKVEYIAGATILGSGRVGLILDVPQMLWQEQPVARQELPKSSADQDYSRHGRAILMVEDQVVTRHMEKGILEAAGYHVVTAENGLDALKKLSKQSFDLVVTDIEMPEMDGFTLTKEIRANEQIQALPVVIVTSMSREEDRRRGVEVGADAYLVKSNFDQRTLIRTIDALLEQSAPSTGDNRQNETKR